MSPWEKALKDAQAFGRGVRDNTVPYALGGPVDMANMALGAVGLGSRRPVGGSDWIRQMLEKAGVTQPSQGDPLEAFGGMVGGMVAPGAARGAGRALYAAEQNAAAPGVSQTAMGRQAGAVNPKKRRAIGTVFDDVADPDEALRMAMRGDHMRRDGSGKLTGSPASVNTPAELRAMRKSVDRKAIDGDWNADWYDRARYTATDLSGDPVKQKLFTRGAAAYSPQAEPNFEVNAFARQYNDLLFGDGTLRPRTESQRVNVQKGIDALDGDQIRLGKKTGPYADAKDPTIPDASLYKTANDIWHGRVYGYKDADGSQFSRGFTPQEHGFLTGENLRASDRLTKVGAPVGTMPAGTPWTPRRMQAATWGAERLPKYIDQVLTKAQKKSGAQATPGQVDLAKRAASGGIDNAVERNTAYVTGEQVPGLGLGHLDNVVGMSEAERAAFSAPRRAALSDAQGRSTLLTDAGMYSRPAVQARGEFTNPQGGVEFNPMSADRPMVGLKSTPKMGQAVEPSNAQGLDALTALQSLITAQHAVPWHHVAPRNSTMQLKAANAARVTAPSESVLDAFKAQLAAQGKLGQVDTGNGLSVMDFGGDMGGAEVQKALKAALKGANAVGPTGLKAVPGRSSGGYVEPFRGAAPGSGEATQRVLDRLKDFPRVEQNIDAAGNWRAGLGRLNELDRQTAMQTGGPVREDIIRLRQILSEQGLAGLRDWIAKNGPKGLPAALLGLGGLQQRDEREESR